MMFESQEIVKIASDYLQFYLLVFFTFRLLIVLEAVNLLHVLAQ